jgi:hypothetical protein
VLFVEFVPVMPCPHTHSSLGLMLVLWSAVRQGFLKLTGLPLLFVGSKKEDRVSVMSF